MVKTSNGNENFGRGSGSTKSGRNPEINPKPHTGNTESQSTCGTEKVKMRTSVLDASQTEEVNDELFDRFAVQTRP